MPKPKKQHGAPPKKSRKMNTFAKLSTTTSGKTKPGGDGAKNSQNGKKNQGQNQTKQQQKRKPIVPFARGDRILLIGEGDFSFARALVTQYKCRHVLATCYDDRETLRAKYPHAEGRNIPEILNAGRSRSGDEEEKDADEDGTQSGQEEQSEQDDDDDDVHHRHHAAQERNPPPSSPRVLYSVDARKLGSPAGGGKEVRYGLARRRQNKKEDKTTPAGHAGAGAWDVICFNFPHVGGLSTDVNRQVRANQELLVGFFKAAVSLLSVPDSEDEDNEDDDEDDYGDGYGSESDGKEPRRTQPGQILVTLFEGEPYTLWNIKDLARHAGLRVVTSFRFPWSSYEGYAHARTLGEVEGKQGGRGGWKGEDREARMYVFENAQVEPTKKEGKKRGRAESESDSD